MHELVNGIAKHVEIVKLSFNNELIWKYQNLLCNTQMEVVKKSLAFDIRYDFKQKSKPFDAYDDVVVLYIHRNR